MAKLEKRNEEINGFPSHFADPKKKNTLEWCSQYVRAMVNEYRREIGAMNVFRPMSQKYKEWRDLARARQDPEQYQDRLGARQRRGQKRKSWRRLNYEILPVAPRFKNTLIDKTIEQDREIGVKAIDPSAISMEKDWANKLRAYMINQSLYNEISKIAGVSFEEPLQDGTPMPDNLADIEIHKDMFFKDEYSMDIRDEIVNVFKSNKWDETLNREIAENLTEVGIAGTKVWIDQRGKVRIRSVTPEKVVGNHCSKDDLSDLIRIGEFWKVSLAELRSMTGDQLTDKEFLDIANKVSGNRYNGKEVYSYYDNYASYPYDHEEVEIFDAEWFSWDEYVWTVKKNGNGRTTLMRQDLNFPFNEKEKKRIPDEDYYKVNPDKEIIRKRFKNLYKCKWITGTPYYFDFGLATNMARSINSLEDVCMSYTFFTTGYDSIMRLLSPVIHNIQMNWLQYQNHLARTRPDGFSIEMSAMENLTLGKGKSKLSPKEALQLYFDTGILFWRRKNWSGSYNNWLPIQELKNQTNDIAARHFANIIREIDFMRDILGLPVVADGTLPQREIGKAVTERVIEGSSNAVGFIFKGFDRIKLGTADKVVKLLPEALEYSFLSQQAHENIIGQRSVANIRAYRFLNLHDVGLFLEQEPDEETRHRLASMIEKSVQSGAIDPEDGYMIEQEKNYYRAVQYLKKKRREKQKQQMEAQKATYDMEKEKNIDSANATADADIRKEQVIHNLKKDLETHSSKLRKDEDDHYTRNKLLIAKFEKGAEMDETEKKILGDLIKASLTKQDKKPVGASGK